MTKPSQSLTALGLALNAVAAELDPSAIANITAATEQLALGAAAQAKAEAAALAQEAQPLLAKLSSEAVSFFDGILDKGLGLLQTKLATWGAGVPAPAAPPTT